MRFSVLAAILLQTLLTVSGSNVPFENCESPAFKPDKVSLSPFPAKRRADFIFTFEGTIDKTISDGSVSYELHYIRAGRKRKESKKVSVERDLCTLIKCPIRTGPYYLSYTRFLPKKLPLGKYKLKFRVTATSGEPLVCILVPFTLEKRTADARGVVIET